MNSVPLEVYPLYIFYMMGLYNFTDWLFAKFKYKPLVQDYEYVLRVLFVSSALSLFFIKLAVNAIG